MFSKVVLPEALRIAVNEFNAWGNEKLTRQQNADTVEDTLYQYTTAAGLHGILKTEVMWCTDYRYLNDPSEFRHGLDLARKMIDEAHSDGLDHRQALFLETADDLLSSEKMDLALRVFISCFSRARDDLGQWRAYGDNGRGFAVGFSPQMFRIVDGEKLPPIEKTFVGSVIYEAGRASMRHRGSIDQVCNIYLKAAIEHQNLLNDPLVRKSFIWELTMSLVGGQLIWDSITTKHPAYSYEAEVRQVVLGTEDSLGGEIKTRVRGNEIVPYVATPWKIRQPGMVTEIVIGPAASLGAEEAVSALLRSFGVSGVKVSRSEIPYRPV